MKRLLLICGLALLLAPAAAAARGTGTQASIISDCGTSCVSGQTIRFTGTGYSAKKSYSGCVYAASGITWCFGIGAGASDGSLSFQIVIVTPDAYTLRVVQDARNSGSDVARTSFTVNAVP